RLCRCGGATDRDGSTPHRRACRLYYHAMEKSPDSSIFASAASAEELEESVQLTPKFDEHGLITAVATDVWSGEVLMVAHMNAEALRKTIETAEAWYFSRS